MADAGPAQHSAPTEGRLPWSLRATTEALRGFEPLLLALIVSVAVMAISEIAARQQFLALLNTQIDDLKGELLELTRVEGPRGADWAGRRDMTEKELNRLRDDRAQLTSLIAVGAGSASSTLQGIRHIDDSKTDLPRSTIGIPRLFLRLLGINLDEVSGDHLLALAVVACGAIGAVIAGIRGDSGTTMRHLSLGFAAGFVTFLGIKGGKHFFLLQAGNDVVAFNPYSSAFAGLLAGLFTERAHRLLSGLVEQMAAKVEALFKDAESSDRSRARPELAPARRQPITNGSGPDHRSVLKVSKEAQTTSDRDHETISLPP